MEIANKTAGKLLCEKVENDWERSAAEPEPEK
jgi:hypothetical protein